jgi:hypothetical protein
VSPVVLFFLNVVSRSNRRNVAAGESSTKRITFIWAIRDPSTHSVFLLEISTHISIVGHIAWISETLGAATKLAPAGLTISVQIYLTGGSALPQLDDVPVKSGKEIAAELDDESYALSLLEDPAIRITSGARPDLKYILQNEADLTAGRMGVTGLCCLTINRSTSRC